jgi:chromosome segregation ATPase
MAKSEPQIDDLRKRLSGLLADWGTEISAVMRVLENQQALAATQFEEVRALEDQANELAKLRQRVRERDLALDHLKKKSKEKDVRLAELEREHKRACVRIEELERKLGALDKPTQHQKGGQQAEVEAMRAELAARKSLVKSLRTDAERGKTLEKKLAEDREVIATMKESIERHASTIAELRRSSDSWERKYRRLAEAANGEPSRDSDMFSDSDIFTDTAVALFLDETVEVDGSHTVVIDMTEPLREARDERRRKGQKG